MNKYDIIKKRISESVNKAREYNHKALLEPSLSKQYFLDVELYMLEARKWKSLLGFIEEIDILIYDLKNECAELKNIELEMNYPRLDDRLYVIRN